MTHESDDELLARLRAVDPASSLPAADPDRVARLLEDTMDNDLLTESRETGARNRGPLTWLVAAAAALIIAGRRRLRGAGDRRRHRRPAHRGRGPDRRADRRGPG